MIKFVKGAFLSVTKSPTKFPVGIKKAKNGNNEVKVHLTMTSVKQKTRSGSVKRNRLLVVFS